MPDFPFSNHRRSANRLTANVCERRSAVGACPNGPVALGQPGALQGIGAADGARAARSVRRPLSAFALAVAEANGCQYGLSLHTFRAATASA